MWPSGETRSDSFSTPFKPPCRTRGSRALIREASRRSNARSMPELLMLMLWGSEPDAADQDVAEHHEVAGEAVPGMRERRGTVVLEEEVTDPRNHSPRPARRPTNARRQ